MHITYWSRLGLQSGFQSRVVKEAFNLLIGFRNSRFFLLCLCFLFFNSLSLSLSCNMRYPLSYRYILSNAFFSLYHFSTDRLPLRTRQRNVDRQYHCQCNQHYHRQLQSLRLVERLPHQPHRKCLPYPTLNTISTGISFYHFHSLFHVLLDAWT